MIGPRTAVPMANQIQGLFYYCSVDMHPPSGPNQGNGPNSPAPFPPFWGGVWARDYLQECINEGRGQHLGAWLKFCAQLAQYFPSSNPEHAPAGQQQLLKLTTKKHAMAMFSLFYGQIY